MKEEVNRISGRTDRSAQSPVAVTAPTHKRTSMGPSEAERRDIFICAY